MHTVEGKVGEEVLVSGSYKCKEHDESWFSFHKNETFRLCPRCKNEHQSNNIWYSVMQTPHTTVKGNANNFMSIIKSILPL